MLRVYASLAFVLTGVGLIYGSYRYGYNEAVEAVQLANAERIEEEVRRGNQISKQLIIAEARLAARGEAISERAEDLPASDSSICNVPDVGVRLVNEARRLSSSTTTEPDGRVSSGSRSSIKPIND